MSHSKGPETISDRIRARLAKRAGSKPPCPHCGQTPRIGLDTWTQLREQGLDVNTQTLKKFVRGATARSDTLDKIVAFLDATSSVKQ